MGRVKFGDLPVGRRYNEGSRGPRKVREILKVTEIGPSRRRKFGLYSVLGLDSGASRLEIARAWRTLALTCHPDKLVGQQKSAATKRFHEISHARDVLLDPHLKTQ